jgi:phage baseplate assembly protein gpV
MKKLAMLFALVFVAGIAAAAQDPKPAAPAKDAPKAAEATAKTHDVEAEVVAYDAAKKALTIKGDPENKTVPVDAKAIASVKDLKAGQKVTLICRDNEKGEHLAVAGVKQAKSAAPEKK